MKDEMDTRNTFFESLRKEPAVVKKEESRKFVENARRSGVLVKHKLRHLALRRGIMSLLSAALTGIFLLAHPPVLHITPLRSEGYIRYEKSSVSRFEWKRSTEIIERDGTEKESKSATS